MQDIYQTIGRRVKEYRKQMGLTQQELAERLNCSASFISRLETGSTMASIQGLWEISMALDINITCFFIDFKDTTPDSLQNSRLRSLFYQLSLLDKDKQSYIAGQIELFLHFIRTQQEL